MPEAARNRVFFGRRGRWFWRLAGLDGRRHEGDRHEPPPSLAWVAALAAWAGVALLGVALADNAARVGAAWAEPAFWISLVALHLPFALRLLWPAVGTEERLAALLLLGLALYAVKLIASPLGPSAADEFQHWAGAEALLRDGRLFVPNPLLPISPFYPGLEIADNALASLCHIGVVPAGLILVGAARFVLVGGIFLFFRAVGLSSRAAGIAGLVYMDSDFTFFVAQFAYETLALAFLAVGLAFAMRARRPDVAPAAPALGATLCLAALAPTHHISSYISVAFLTAAALLGMVGAAPRGRRWLGWAIAAVAIGTVVGWDTFVGHPSWNYLAPAFEASGREAARILRGEATGRRLFVSSAGAGTAAWRQVIGLMGVALEMAAIATGTLRAFNRFRTPRVRLEMAVPWLLAAASAAYPLSLLLRFTHAGWEVSNRSAAFLFIGVAFAASLAVTEFSQARSLSPVRLMVVGSALSLMYLAGVTESCCALQPGAYAVAADDRSVERVGIDTARWMRERLGADHVIAGDRVNSLLMAAYGSQHPVTLAATHIDLAPLFLLDEIGDDELAALRQSGAEFLVVDRRLSRGLPTFGNYFDEGEDERVHAAPPTQAALAKFDGMPGVDLIYDAGPIGLYDVRRLR